MLCGEPDPGSRPQPPSSRRQAPSASHFQRFARIAPTADYAHSFALPASCLRVISAGIGKAGRGLDYRVQGQKLLADAESLTLTYQRSVPESEFPAFFLGVLITRLAAELCLPLTEGTSRAESLYQLAAAELRLARLLDSQQSTPRRVEDFTLVEARY